ncbi:MAG: tRNA lysidine(34) synthetase TilS, partial [Bacteroidales bacterium]|nr:tRNA lysidine(34) synthetase TilS [Bacteroidales bacterium]
DQIETFFINMLRGTGIAGLHGILPKQKHLIHPMLFTYKKDIEKFILDHKLDFRKDTSNQSIKYLRNKIRHKIIPLFEEINPDFEILLNKNIERIREAENIFKKTINKEKNKILQFKDNKILISISSLKKLHPVKTFLFEFLSSYNFNFSVIEDIIASLDNISGKQFYSSTHRLIKDREHLIITKIPARSLYKDEPIIKQEYFINENETVINSPVKLKINKIPNNEKFVLKKNKKIASLDYDKLKFPLKIRKWKTGDYFFPFGMTTRKKISDFFIDNKFSLLDKENTWLLCSDNKIIWIVGFRIDNRFKVTKKTKKIFQIMYLKN